MTIASDNAGTMVSSAPSGSVALAPLARHMSQCKVSVIIPTYNCGEFIGDALRSVASQTYNDLEIIVVDDHSNDQTREAVQASGVPCRYVMNQRTKGPAGARNHGILQSRGQYIAFLDADDAWLPGKLVAQLDVFQSDPQLVAIGGQMIAWDAATMGFGGSPEVRRYSFGEMVVRNRLGTPSVVCRRDAFETIGLFDEAMNISEDYELWLRLSQVGAVARIEIPLVRIRQRAEGASAGDRDRTHTLDVAFAESLPDRYPDVPDIHCLVKKGLSARALDRAIELCDVEKRYREALRATVASMWNWPWSNPMETHQPFVRLRRIRRILVDALTMNQTLASNQNRNDNHASTRQPIQ